MVEKEGGFRLPHLSLSFGPRANRRTKIPPIRPPGFRRCAQLSHVQPSDAQLRNVPMCSLPMHNFPYSYTSSEHPLIRHVIGPNTR